jgi:hypothetical protein
MKQFHSLMVLSEVQQAIIKTLLYFDIFSYPLTSAEIFKFCDVKETQAEIDQALDDLVKEEHLYQFDDLYSLHNNRQLIDRRLKGNKAALEMLPVAQRQAKLIARFPFIRAVMASGSLSKGYMDETSDLDFFIVTEPGKLWIARSLLVMYKRIFLLNSHKRFCVNYFIDAEHLTIEEKNLFTATELATVIPLFSYPMYTALHRQNTWLTKFFPNYQSRSSDTEIQFKKSLVTWIVEMMLKPVSTPLEKLSMATTLNRWRRLYGNYDPVDFSVAFKSKKYASKSHPRHFQKKVMEKYAEKVREFGLTSGIALV